MNWISVKKQLPEYFKPVLVCVVTKRIFDNKTERYVLCGYYDNNEEWCLTTLYEDENLATVNEENELIEHTVTHWAFMPELPKE